MRAKYKGELVYIKYEPKEHDYALVSYNKDFSKRFKVNKSELKGI